MVTTKPVDTQEPKITREEILFLQDENFLKKIFLWLKTKNEKTQSITVYQENHPHIKRGHGIQSGTLNLDAF